MTELIIEFFEQNKTFIKLDELKKKLKIKGEEQTEIFYSAINALVEDGSLFFDSKKGYKLFTNDLGYAYGEIEINKSGNGIIRTNDGVIFIPYEDLNGALNGDKVLVSSISFGRGELFKGEVYKVLKRKNGNVIFEVIGNGLEASIIPCNNENIAVSINKNELRKLVDGEIILVKVGTEKNNGEYLAEIEKVIGHRNDANIDIKMIYEKYDVPIEFSKEALEEVDKLPVEVKPEEIKDRVDLRDKPIITIDCDGTKDRDDAVYAERLSNGNIKLYVSISAVNYYVKRGTKLFEEAKDRNTSYYPNNTCNPLFPPKLSNGICSLNENVDRLTKTCEMEIDSNGNIVNYDIYNSVIRSRKAMKYSEVNKVLKGEMVDGYEEYENQLRLLSELNECLEQARINRECIDFGIHDIELEQDKDGKTLGFVTRGDGVAERIIENCMLVTGTTIAEHFSWLPFIYRIHEAPDQITVNNVIKLLRLSGINIPKYNNVSEKTLNNILDRIKNTEEAKVVRTMLLKSMKRARYDVNNIGHFALQLSKYTHFTSPIRRITDFMIHTLIDELENFDYSKENIDMIEREFKEVCEKASTAERVSKAIEDEALAMSMAEYMEEHIGEEFNAIVTEVYPHGMFVQTDDNISGKVKFENMLGDYYYYYPDKNAIIGKNTKKKYQIGNRICVVVKDASKATRTINFEIGEQKKKSLRK